MEEEEPTAVATSAVRWQQHCVGLDAVTAAALDVLSPDDTEALLGALPSHADPDAGGGVVGGGGGGHDQHPNVTTAVMTFTDTSTRDRVDGPAAADGAGGSGAASGSVPDSGGAGG